MGKKGILLIAGLLFFGINISSGQESMQGGQGRPSMGDRGGSSGQNLSKDIQELVSAEKTSAATASNVQEQYKKLTRIVSGMLRSGRSVAAILPKDEGNRIDALMKDGNLEEAAGKVHDVIMKLEAADTGKSDPGSGLRPRQDMMQGSRSDTSHSDTSRFVQSVPVSHLDIHQMANKNSFDNILKLMNPAIDSVNRRLYFGGSKSSFIGVVDIDTDELVETFDIGIPCGFLIPDFANGAIYSLELGSANRIYKIDVKQKRAEEVSSLPSYISIPKKGEPTAYKGLIYKETGYPFVAGYLQEENAAYGIIVITDAAGRQTGKIKHGPDALYFAIGEKTGKLYTTNTGDGSLSIFDLNNKNRKIKDIDVGNSLDEIVLDQRNGGLYIRNRLGGSTIYYYDQNTKALTAIPNENIAGNQGIGMWPTQIIYDDSKLYILSHYGGRIDVLNTITNKLVDSIPLSLSYKPRTDGISTMVMDKTRKILYAAFPELGELAIADAKHLKPIKTVKIERFDTKKIGPGRIVLSVDERLNKVLAYLSEEKRLIVLNGDTYVFEEGISLDVGRAERLLTSNAEKGVLYAGNRILDAATLEEKGSFTKGDKVIAFDNAKNRIYLVGKTVVDPRKMIEKVYEFEGATIIKEWTLSPVFSIPSSFVFDFANSRFYVGYFESAVVEAFDLIAGSKPSSEPAGLFQYERKR